MKLRTFQGQSMAEALERVKQQYGRGAVILNTRTVTKGGFLGLGGKPVVEITAARAMSDLPPTLRRGSALRRSGRAESAIGVAPLMASTSTVLPAKPPSDALISEVGALKSLVGELVLETRRSRSSTIPGELYEHYHNLVESRVAEGLAGRLVGDVQRQLSADQMRDPAAVRQQLAESLAAMLPTAGPICLRDGVKPFIVALIGPTGVGKTTTIAKLAANFCLREGRKVGLITLDTYRIAAIEQLKTYAQIIDVPLEAAASPEHLKEAIARMGDRDIILIDTAGRGQRDTIKLNDLRAFFDVAKPNEVHLVLSATCAEAVLTETMKRFSDVGLDRIIFTKLDEAVGFGVILNCLEKVKARLSYVTTGQDVPSDIEVGAGPTIAALILGKQDAYGGLETPGSAPPSLTGGGRGTAPRSRRVKAPPKPA